MKQYEAVIKVMESHGGFATLGQLYQDAVKVRGVEWGTQTPNASIRRIVQDHKDKFFKIKPGLWALLAWKDGLPDELRLGKSPTQKAKNKQRLFDHSYYQGLILQIGNIQRFKTYIPPQDKNRLFLRRTPLGSLATCAKIYDFAYARMMKNARMIDVIWFNDRKMPAAVFEIEHTTDMMRSMIKFNELRDFRSEMYIVARREAKQKFEGVRALDTFKNIKKYVTFLPYDMLSNDHSRVCASEFFGPGVQGVYATN
jgi:hypothetical protein